MLSRVEAHLFGCVLMSRTGLIRFWRRALCPVPAVLFLIQCRDILCRVWSLTPLCGVRRRIAQPLPSRGCPTKWPREKGYPSPSIPQPTWQRPPSIKRVMVWAEDWLQLILRLFVTYLIKKKLNWQVLHNLNWDVQHFKCARGFVLHKFVGLLNKAILETLNQSHLYF